MRNPADPSAAERWRAELAAWAIPDDILNAAPESPWGFPPELFRVEPGAPADTPSRRRALAALTGVAEPSVLDVGCGGGAAGLALAPPAVRVIGVDSSPDLLAEFAAAAEGNGVPHEPILGRWPDVADRVPVADVVVCHHVGYNVPELGVFAVALAAHARRRVVMELTDVHPLVATAPLWERFHGLPRPTGPTAELAVQVLREAGIEARAERFSRAPRRHDRGVLVAFTRRRLCLPPERDAEVDAALGPDPRLSPAGAVTLWWDVRAGDSRAG